MDKEAFLKPRLPEREVELPGVGAVRVRGLSRAEILAAQRMAADGDEAMERFVLLLGLVDPALTADEVGVWHSSATSAEITLIIDAVKELSGLAEGAAKAAYKSVPGDPGP